MIYLIVTDIYLHAMVSRGRKAHFLVLSTAAGPGTEPGIQEKDLPKLLTKQIDEDLSNPN